MRVTETESILESVPHDTKKEGSARTHTQRETHPPTVDAHTCTQSLSYLFLPSLSFSRAQFTYAHTQANGVGEIGEGGEDASQPGAHRRPVKDAR